jgi:hypothetical protein
VLIEDDYTLIEPVEEGLGEWGKHRGHRSGGAGHDRAYACNHREVS